VHAHKIAWLRCLLEPQVFLQRSAVNLLGVVLDVPEVRVCLVVCGFVR
jgi:hypothetical protein